MLPQIVRDGHVLLRAHQMPLRLIIWVQDNATELAGFPGETVPTELALFHGLPLVSPAYLRSSSLVSCAGILPARSGLSAGYIHVTFTLKRLACRLVRVARFDWLVRWVRGIRWVRLVRQV